MLESVHISRLNTEYVLSDMNSPLTNKVPRKREHGCQLPLSNGNVVTVTVTPLTRDIILCSFTTDGINVETFDAPKRKGSYFNQCKTRIEKKYETTLLETDRAREVFADYLAQFAFQS